MAVTVTVRKPFHFQPHPFQHLPVSAEEEPLLSPTLRAQALCHNYLLSRQVGPWLPHPTVKVKLTHFSYSSQLDSLAQHTFSSVQSGVLLVESMVMGKAQDTKLKDKA